VKRTLIWVIAAFIAALAVCVSSGMMVGYITATAQDYCARAVMYAGQGRTEEALDELTALANIWKKWAGVLETIASHEDMHDAYRQLVDAQNCLLYGDMDDFVRCMAQLGEALEHLRDQEELRLSNIC